MFCHPALGRCTSGIRPVVGYLSSNVRCFFAFDVFICSTLYTTFFTIFRRPKNSYAFLFVVYSPPSKNVFVIHALGTFCSYVKRTSKYRRFVRRSFGVEARRGGGCRQTLTGALGNVLLAYILHAKLDQNQSYSAFAPAKCFGEVSVT